MSTGVWTTGRISGTLLVLSTLLIAAEFVVVLTQGKFDSLVKTRFEEVPAI